MLYTEQCTETKTFIIAGFVWMLSKKGVVSVILKFSCSYSIKIFGDQKDVMIILIHEILQFRVLVECKCESCILYCNNN